MNWLACLDTSEIAELCYWFKGKEGCYTSLPDSLKIGSPVFNSLLSHRWDSRGERGFLCLRFPPVKWREEYSLPHRSYEHEYIKKVTRCCSNGGSDNYLTKLLAKIFLWIKILAWSFREERFQFNQYCCHQVLSSYHCNQVTKCLPQ